MPTSAISMHPPAMQAPNDENSSVKCAHLHACAARVRPRLSSARPSAHHRHLAKHSALLQSTLLTK